MAREGLYFAEMNSMSTSREFLCLSDDFVVITADIEDCPLVDIPLTELFDLTTCTLVANYLQVLHCYVIQLLEDTVWMDIESFSRLLFAGYGMYHDGKLLDMEKAAFQRHILQTLRHSFENNQPFAVSLITRFSVPDTGLPRPLAVPCNDTGHITQSRNRGGCPRDLPCNNASSCVTASSTRRHQQVIPRKVGRSGTASRSATASCHPAENGAQTVEVPDDSNGAPTSVAEEGVAQDDIGNHSYNDHGNDAGFELVKDICVDDCVVALVKAGETDNGNNFVGKNCCLVHKTDPALGISPKTTHHVLAVDVKAAHQRDNAPLSGSTTDNNCEGSNVGDNTTMSGRDVMTAVNTTPAKCPHAQHDTGHNLGTQSLAVLTPLSIWTDIMVAPEVLNGRLLFIDSPSGPEDHLETGYYGSCCRGSCPHRAFSIVLDSAIAFALLLVPPVSRQIVFAHVPGAWCLFQAGAEQRLLTGIALCLGCSIPVGGVPQAFRDGISRVLMDRNRLCLVPVTSSCPKFFHKIEPCVSPPQDHDDTQTNEVKEEKSEVVQWIDCFGNVPPDVMVAYDWHPDVVCEIRVSIDICFTNATFVKDTAAGTTYYLCIAFPMDAVVILISGYVSDDKINHVGVDGLTHDFILVTDRSRISIITMPTNIIRDRGSLFGSFPPYDDVTRDSNLAGVLLVLLDSTNNIIVTTDPHANAFAATPATCRIVLLSFHPVVEPPNCGVDPLHVIDVSHDLYILACFDGGRITCPNPSGCTLCRIALIQATHLSSLRLS